MEWDQMSGEGPGMCGSDRDLFGFMWRRADPNGGIANPVAAGENLPMPQYIQEEYLPPMTDAAAESGMLPMNSAVQGGLPDVLIPEQEALSCLSPASAAYGEQLQNFIAGELSDYKTYSALAKRTSGKTSRMFSCLAADERQHARRLTTAYFLITGIQYWPMDQVTAHLEGVYLVTLRVRFQEEQEGANAYQKAAEETADPCLKELYLELSKDEDCHSRQLRELLESMLGA